MPPLLYLLALGNLVIGSSAFVTTGLVSLISEGLGVSLQAAGQAMTAYALATAVFAPVLVAATGRWTRKRALLFALALFTVGNALCATAPNLVQLYAGRLLMGAGSMFTPVAAGIALAAVDPARRGKALSTVFLGMSLSYVIGVPIGAWVGATYGWQAALWGMTAATGVLGLMAALLVPTRVQAPGVQFEGIGDVLRQPAALKLLVMTALYFSAIFTVFSYIAPVFRALVEMSATRLSVTLMIFGMAGAAGTILGGWASDRFGPHRSAMVLLATLGTMMLLLPLTRGSYPLLLLVMVVWGMAGFGMMAPQQARLAQLAPSHAPLLLSLNASMLYVGTALGAALGGAAALGVGFDHLPWVGAPLAFAGWLLNAGSAPRRGAALEMGGHGPK